MFYRTYYQGARFLLLVPLCLGTTEPSPLSWQMGRELMCHGGETGGESHQLHLKVITSRPLVLCQQNSAHTTMSRSKRIVGPLSLEGPGELPQGSGAPGHFPSLTVLQWVGWEDWFQIRRDNCQIFRNFENWFLNTAVIKN